MTAPCTWSDNPPPPLERLFLQGCRVGDRSAEALLNAAALGTCDLHLGPLRSDLGERLRGRSRPHPILSESLQSYLG